LLTVPRLRLVQHLHADRLRALGLERAAGQLPRASLRHLLLQIDAIDLLQDVLELVREQLAIVLAELHDHVGADRAGRKPVNRRLRPHPAAVERVRDVDLHTDARRLREALALRAERLGSPQQRDHVGREHARIDVRRNGRRTPVLLPFSDDDR